MPNLIDYLSQYHGALLSPRKIGETPQCLFDLPSGNRVVDRLLVQIVQGLPALDGICDALRQNLSGAGEISVLHRFSGDLLIELIPHLAGCTRSSLQPRFEGARANRILIVLPESALWIGRSVELVCPFLDGCAAPGRVGLHVWCYSPERVQDVLGRVSFGGIR